MAKRTIGGKEVTGTWVFIHGHANSRLKRLAKQQELDYNEIIGKAFRFFEDNGGSQAAAP